MITGFFCKRAVNLSQGFQQATRSFGDVTRKSWGSSLHILDAVKPTNGVQQQLQSFLLSSSSSKQEDSMETDMILNRMFSQKMPLLGLSGSISSAGSEFASPHYYQSQLSLTTNKSFGDAVDIYDPNEIFEIYVMNRNARKPNKANKGARPCSRASRRRKKNALGKRKRS